MRVLGSALLWVALGAIPGALLRWILPSTMVANTLGCWLFGAAGLLDAPTRRRRWLVGVGFASSLTSFSTWILELVRHLERGQWLALLVQIFRDGGLGLIALQLGATLHRCSIKR
ncbi:MAG: CrcB family protein [Cyanobacteriota bacterium]|jgi:CrcB protein|nr:CrcB family protein [Cyanobacteriota bacterium]